MAVRRVVRMVVQMLTVVKMLMVRSDSVRETNLLLAVMMRREVNNISCEMYQYPLQHKQ